MSFLLLLFWVEVAPAELNCRHLPGSCGGMAAKQRVVLVATETAAVGWAAAAAARAKAVVVGWATGTAAPVARPATGLPKADAVLRTTLGSTLAHPVEVSLSRSTCLPTWALARGSRPIPCSRRGRGQRN